MKSWVLAARPKTLPAAIAPVWVGSMPALLDGNPITGSWLLFWFTLLSCILIQIATNLFNDAIDHKKGADTEQRLGPRRATASGWLRPQAVLMGAMISSVLAAITAMPLIAERGWPIVLIGIVSIFFSYGYTGGPFPLAYLGLGELFVILFFGFVAILGSHFVQTGDWGDWNTVLLGLECGLYSSVLIAVNNLRDVEEDERSGKKTLAVRFGVGFARVEILVFCMLPVLIWNLTTPISSMAVLYLGAIPAFLGLIVTWSVFRFRPGMIYNRILAIAALQLIFFAVVATLREVLLSSSAAL